MACCIFALAILIAPAAIAQSMVSGTVVDGQNEPVIGASVMVKGTTSGVATGIDGDFSIAAKPSDVLKVSAVGYKTAEVKVEGTAPIRITLEESSEVLDEVVVIGYGTSTKKELTGSVASMKKEELNPGTFPNAMGMLQGKVAGLQIVNPSGADPTAKYEILLRGTNTLAAGQGPLVIIDGVAGADIRNINPQDIESIDVLKDGSAAAIYGTRGTNGVIIVTTRRAREGRAEVTYEGQFTVGKVTRRAVPLTASEFNYVIDTYRPELSGSKYGADTDWFDEITRTPISHKHTLSLSGGTEKFSHFTSLNYEKAEGVQRGNDFEKIAGRTNIRQSLLEGWVDVDVNLFITHRKYNPSNTSAFQQAFIHNPTEPVYDPSNSTSGGYYRIEAMEYYNPVAMINERTSTTVNDNFGGNARVTLNIKPVKGLKWDAFLALSRESNESKTYSTHYYPSIIGTDGSAEISNYKNNDTQFETTLNYIRSFGPHSLQALLGYTYQKGTENSAGMSNVGFDFDDTETNDIGSGTGLLNGKAGLSSYKESHTYIGFFGRVLYNHALRIMRNALKHSTSYDIKEDKGGIYYNLLDSHAPFQIDGNFGFSAGVAEMLLQGYDGTLRLLPALPDAWQEGHANGLRAVGNFEVDQRWTAGRLTEAVVKSGSGRDVSVSYKGIANAKVTDASGNAVTVTADGEDRISFPTTSGGRYTIDLSANSGISAVASDATAAPEEYFDLQGRRVAADTLSAGIYIRRAGSVAEKVALR